MKYILLIVLIPGLSAINLLMSQNTDETLFYVRIDDENGPVKLKWFTDKIVSHEGFNVYRQKQGTNDREKLNNEPLKPGAKPIPEARLTEELEGFSEIISKPDYYLGKEPMLDFILIPYFISNEHFAQFAGIRFDDATAAKGSEYVYIIEEIKEGNEVEIVRSEPITAGELRLEEAPKEIISKSSNTKIKIGWKAEPERYYAVNIYRAPADDPENATKINDEPVRFNNEGGGVSKYPFQDLGLNKDDEFIYSLKSVDYFGLEAQTANPVKFGTQDVIPPTPPFNLEIDGDDASLTLVLEWEAEIPDDFKSFTIHYSRGSDSDYKPVIESLPAVQKTVEYQVEEAGEHFFKIESADVNNNSSFSEPISKNLIDVIPPEVPKNVITEIDTGMVLISWDAVDDKDLMGYIVYRQQGDESRPYNRFNRVPITETSFTNQLPENVVGGYKYKVVAVDTNGNKSSMSNVAQAVFEDRNPPPKPFITRIALNDENQPEVNWQEIAAGDLQGIDVYRRLTGENSEWQKVNINILRPETKTYRDRSAEPGGTYEYSVIATDTAGNVSPRSNAKSIKIARDKSATAELKKFKAKTRRRNNNIEFEWEVNDPASVVGYVLYGKNPGDKQLKPVTGKLNTMEYTIKKPAAGKHEFMLKIYDNKGNKIKSEVVTVEISE